MKKIILIIVAFVSVLVLSACTQPCFNGDYTQVKGHSNLLCSTKTNK